jgi:hypothetical protein
MLQGATITEFVFWPSVTENGFYWGYVRFTGTTDWLCDAAPYFCDFLTFSLFFLLLMWVPIRKKWIWLNLIIIGLISPLVNSAYNYWGRGSSRNDVGKLLETLPGAVAHWFFVTSLLVYVVGILLVLRYSKSAVDYRTSLVDK